MNIDKRNGSYSKTRKTKDRKENTLYINGNLPTPDYSYLLLLLQ